jgi:hypothetical protein
MRLGRRGPTALGRSARTTQASVHHRPPRGATHPSRCRHRGRLAKGALPGLSAGGCALRRLLRARAGAEPPLCQPVRRRGAIDSLPPARRRPHRTALKASSSGVTRCRGERPGTAMGVGRPSDSLPPAPLRSARSEEGQPVSKPRRGPRPAAQAKRRRAPKGEGSDRAPGLAGSSPEVREPGPGSGSRRSRPRAARARFGAGRDGEARRRAGALSPRSPSRAPLRRPRGLAREARRPEPWGPSGTPRGVPRRGTGPHAGAAGGLQEPRP